MEAEVRERLLFKRLGTVTWRLTENNRFVNIGALKTKKQTKPQ